MHQKTQFKLNIGLSSILLIFVVLCLVSFAILSLVSANADKKLSIKMLERNRIYYEVSNHFEADCALLHDTLNDIYSKSKNEKEYYKSIGETTHTYQYVLSDLQYLEIIVEYLYPSTPHDPFYKIVSRKIVTDDSIEYDTHLNVIE